jgi:hypothetical protein
LVYSPTDDLSYEMRLIEYLPTLIKAGKVK